MANPALLGIHHVTAITADAQANLDFYSGVLGLRLVKMTVNFDDPTSYHFYYGDDTGHPGTIMTFFAWPGGHSGIAGAPQVTVTAFAVPRGALQFWTDRLRSHNVRVQPTFQRFGEDVLPFRDPDGLNLEIIATDAPPNTRQATGSGIPPELTLRGFHGVTLAVEGYERTAELLTEHMGYTLEQRDNNRFRYRIKNGCAPGGTVDVLCAPESRRGRMGTGVVHHVAFRTPDDDEQEKWLRTVRSLGFNSSPVMDRQYFRSIYFREPAGILFEIATDAPGFAVNEAPTELGRRMMLPAQYEAMRAQIERALPPVKVPRTPAPSVD